MAQGIDRAGMVCVCKNTMERLVQAMQPAAAADPPPAADHPDAAAANTDTEALQSLAGWMGRHGLPAPPWQPDPAWLDIELPAAPLDPAALATLSAFAQLRASTEALGIDLLDPAQAKAFTRMVATLHQRLAALEPSPAETAAEWTQLAAAQTAAEQVQQALAQGVLPAPASSAEAPLSVWRPFLNRLRPLLPLIAAVQQLRLPDPETMADQLGAMLRTMLRIPVPPPLAPAAQQRLAEMLATLSALARLRDKLGCDPLAQGLAATRRQVAEQVAAATQAVQDATGQSPTHMLARLAPRDYCPTLMAPPAVVQAAQALRLPPLPWRVPAVADVALLRVGQPAVAFIAQMNAVLGSTLATTLATTPCANGCDAASVLRAAMPTT